MDRIAQSRASGATLATKHPENRQAPHGTRLKTLARNVFNDDRKLQVALLGLMVPFYALLLGISWRLSLNNPVDLTFNSMLDHMLRGQFDVDPQIVQYEGFLRNGRVYSYFGVWCALLRLPLWLFNRMNLNVTFPSCLAAVCLAGLAKIRAVLLIRKKAPRSRDTNYAIGLMLAYVVLAGSAVSLLEVSIYHEALLWAYAFAAIFVYAGIGGILNRRFNLATLSCMTACAGLALLARVTVGMGLIIAILLLLLALAMYPPDGENDGNSLSRRPLWPRVRTSVLIPLAILATFVGVAGAVNYFRWGNPITFADYNSYFLAHEWPNFLPSLHMYGAFNLRRIPYGLIYYFFPIWVLHASSGHLLCPTMQTPLFGLVTLPPSTFFLTDLLPLFFIVFLAIAVRRGAGIASSAAGYWATAVSVGLLAPCVFMLGFTWLLFRYRMEFYPEIDFLALLGLYFTVTNGEIRARFLRVRGWLKAALTVSIFASLLAFALNELTDDHSQQAVQAPGVVTYYRNQVEFHLHRTLERLK